ncbi:hypothetical protein GCM10011611_51420 [Aliidongia dinghuensis]|uniref:Uncharacterized protein n=1 Tax=Aliidongia dinghuensis TaxID=1867774 RepID=A0A8J2YZ18_9PROT|nr:hypothetical protein [Aliidongia dinghuensis]GGF38787.1 hypothetical protein GCM10011611_51420 [Aliidongia dinghuensis]
MLLSPVVSALALPALTACGATGLIRTLRGKKGDMRLAEAGLGIGFLAGFWAVTGGLPFLGNVAYHQLGEAVALALGVGLITALVGAGPGFTKFLGLAGALFAVVWLTGWRQLMAPTVEELLTIVVYGAIAAAAALRLAALGPGATPIAVTGLAALALAFVALFGHAAGTSDLALALAGACLGSLVWAWPLGRAGVGPATIAVLATGFTGLMVAEARGALHAPWALLPLPLAFWAPEIADRLPALGRLARKKPTRPLALLFAAALPCAAAVGLAFLLGTRLYF